MNDRGKFLEENIERVINKILHAVVCKNFERQEDCREDLQIEGQKDSFVDIKYMRRKSVLERD